LDKLNAMVNAALGLGLGLGTAAAASRSAVVRATLRTMFGLDRSGPISTSDVEVDRLVVVALYKEAAGVTEGGSSRMPLVGIEVARQLVAARVA
jgi:hypothetical protein